jgi:type VI secretion system protein ImpM
VSEILTDARDAGVFRDAAIGFHGKIPARGDFVQAGLPRAFTDPWDSWMQEMIAASRAVLGEVWLPAWLEAAVWRFVLSPGICGRGAVIGLWMPSVDSVGRYFPLTLAAVTCNADARGLLCAGGGFLAVAEDAGREALAMELPPEKLAARLATAITAPYAAAGGDPSLCPADGGLWWTEGAPRVSAAMFASTGLPNENTFDAMLVSCSSMPSAYSPEVAG